jgi:hypothetical protein
MKNLRERSSTEHSERSERQASARTPKAPESTVRATFGLTLDRLGNQALLSLLRSGRLQRMARVSQPGDEYEREADRAAEQVMRMPEPRIQPACACGGGCRKCRNEQQGRDQESFQTKRVQASDAAQISVPPIVHEVLRSPGQSLDPATRAFMEPRFGRDFSRVRTHSGAAAERSAAEVNAKAYTVGHDIVFAAGRLAPEMPEGRRLLAHELTHVVQQAGADGIGIDQTGERRDRSQASTDVGSGVSRPGIHARTGTGLQRAPDDKSGYKQGTEGWAGLVQAAIEALDADADGKTLEEIISSARSREWLKLWALKLQGILSPDNINYLFLFFTKLKHYDGSIAIEYANLLVQYGIEISPVSGSFQSLDYLDPSVTAPLNPAIAQMPLSKIVDNFASVTYELDYKPKRQGSLSEKLQVSYSDGTKIDIDFLEISDNIDYAWANAIGRSYIGPGQRVFPSRMSRNTTPRLWKEKQKAVGQINRSNQEFETFVSIGLAGVMSNLPMGPVAGLEPPVAESVGGREGARGISLEGGRTTSEAQGGTPLLPRPGEPQIREVSFNPETGEAVYVAQDPVTGRYAVLRANVWTGQGSVIGSGGETVMVSGGRLVPTRPGLPAGSAVIELVEPGTGLGGGLALPREGTSPLLLPPGPASRLLSPGPSPFLLPPGRTPFLLPPGRTPFLLPPGPSTGLLSPARSPLLLPPASAPVWVNTRSGVFHRLGSPWYGVTKDGVMMTPDDAIGFGFREAGSPSALQPIEPVTIGGTQMESKGASPRGSAFISARARVSSSLITAIRADTGEALAYSHALRNGEFGLRRPIGSNIPGSDFITAARIFQAPARGAASVRALIYVNDVKTSGVPSFPAPAATIKAKWRAELADAIRPGQLDLGDPALEAAIRDAVTTGDIYIRQINVDVSESGQGSVAEQPAVRVGP